MSDLFYLAESVSNRKPSLFVTAGDTGMWMRFEKSFSRSEWARQKEGLLAEPFHTGKNWIFDRINIKANHISNSDIYRIVNYPILHIPDCGNIQQDFRTESNKDKYFHYSRDFDNPSRSITLSCLLVFRINKRNLGRSTPCTPG